MAASSLSSFRFDSEPTRNIARDPKERDENKAKEIQDEKPKHSVS